MGAREFLEEYFIVPLYHDTFNPINTVVYAALFMVLLFAVLYVFKKLRIEFDRDFYSYFILYIFLGGLMGALRDTQHFSSPLLSTVGIYGLIFTMLLAGVIAGKVAEGAFRVPYNAVPFLAAAAGIIILLINYPPGRVGFGGLFFILLLGVLPTIIVTRGARVMGLGLMENKINQGVLLAHMLDASSTYVGVAVYGFREKFFITSYVMQTFTPASIFLLKAGAVLAVLYLMEKSRDPMNEAIKAAIITLGLAPAVRNTFLSVFA